MYEREKRSTWGGLWIVLLFETFQKRERRYRVHSCMICLGLNDRRRGLQPPRQGQLSVNFDVSFCWKECISIDSHFSHGFGRRCSTFVPFRPHDPIRPYFVMLYGVIYHFQPKACFPRTCHWPVRPELVANRDLLLLVQHGKIPLYQGLHFGTR